jgi:hypothetical protein
VGQGRDVIAKHVERGLVAVGIAIAAAGGSGLALRPEPVVYPSADLDGPILVIPPSALALDGLDDIIVTSAGTFTVWAGRPSDVYAWAAAAEVDVVRGLETWEDIQVDRAGTMSGEVSEFRGDLAREWAYAFEEASIEPSGVDPGLAVVAVSGSGAPFESLVFEMSRDRGNGWGWPTLAAGLGAVVVGLALAVVRLIGERIRALREAAS